jgi:ferrous iron transport protein B
MTSEIIVTVVLVSFAAFIFYKNIRKKTSGDCSCCSGNKSKRKLGK